jgi:putative Mg2+ transporter-C (MgtC) family protein
MLEIFEFVRQLDFVGITARLCMAVFCGGLIGLEREYKRRPAGFRTHILICMGAAMTTLASQYLYLEMHYQTDLARLGAQVIAGIGFIGARTIIVTRRQRIKGLTTAAGLWATAIIGLALGAGFYEGGILATILILTVELLLSKVAYQVRVHTPELNIYVEYKDRTCLDQVVQVLQSQDIRVLNMEVMRSASSEGHSASAIFLLRLQRSLPANELLCTVTAIEGVATAEEL